jgi:hypothetical protein
MQGSRISNLLLILMLIVIAGAVFYIVQTIQQTTQQTLAPFQQANNSLQTQVAGLLHPTPTVIPDPITYISQIQALARLETIQYGADQVVTVEDREGTWAAFVVGQTLLVQVHGTVIAGIDMAKVQPGDLQMQNGVLTVKLPPAEIFAVTVDEDKSKVFSVHAGLFAKPDPGLVLPALSSAKDKIQQAAIDDGILETARQNAVTYLTKFFAALGYSNTIFVNPPPD